MQFLKRLFSRTKTTTIEIEGVRGTDALFDLLGRGAGGHAGRYEPLFFLKDHEDLQKIFKANKEKQKFLEKQAEALADQAQKGHEETWEKVEQYMKANGLWPKNHPEGQPICLKTRDGVMLHHVHE